jgi:hypothetical protein
MMKQLTEAAVYARARRQGLSVRRVRTTVVCPHCGHPNSRAASGQWRLSCWPTKIVEGCTSAVLLTGTLEEIALYLDGGSHSGRGTGDRQDMRP